MPPGPVLAGLADRVWRDGLDGLDDDELTGVLQAAERLGAWAAALKLSAVSNVVSRREAEGQASGDWRPFEHADDEVALALTLTRWSAGNLLGLAVSLNRLPLARAALGAGQIDERRAAVIADELTGLDDEHAAAVEACIIGNAPGQTTSQLRAAARRAVIAADPAAAKRRKEKALKDARVQAFTEPAGTAGLSGRDLPPADVLAADKNLTALAEAIKRAGAEGTMDLLRARVYLHLLSGQSAETLLTRTAAGTGTPATGTPETGTAGSGTAGSGTPGDESPAGSGSGTGPADQATPGSGAPGSGAPGSNTPGPGLPALRGTVNLTMPLATWLGWSQSPGDVPGFGPLDADDSRALAGLLAAHPANQWCVTLTDPAGRPVAHGCAKTGPGAHPPPRPGPAAGSGSRPRAGPANSTGPPGDLGWIRGLTITHLQTRDCTHPRETRGYQIGPALRHLIQIRQATCSRPGCRRAATRCDMDHTVPYHLGGRSCECNVGPVCRHDHTTKQTPGWTVTQIQPGIMTWTTPGNRTYTTGPTCYPE